MIRFIDLGNQIYPYDKERNSFMFAWWNTVTDTFETFNFEQAWDSWKEFAWDFKNDPDYENVGEMFGLDRYKELFPKDWPRGVEEE